MSTFRLEDLREVRQMARRLRIILTSRNFTQALDALRIACGAHALQERDDGKPYIIHPLRMALEAVEYEGVTDSLIAIILLHDVIEDCGIRMGDLPLSFEVRLGVELMTFRKLPKESKEEAKRRYYQNLSLYPLAIICKLLDREDNLRDGDDVIGEERMAKNLRETRDKLFPAAVEARKPLTIRANDSKAKKVSELGKEAENLLNIINILMPKLEALVDNLALKYHIDQPHLPE